MSACLCELEWAASLRLQPKKQCETILYILHTSFSNTNKITKKTKTKRSPLVRKNVFPPILLSVLNTADSTTNVACIALLMLHNVGTSQRGLLVVDINFHHLLTYLIPLHRNNLFYSSVQGTLQATFIRYFVPFDQRSCNNKNNKELLCKIHEKKLQYK